MRPTVTISKYLVLGGVALSLWGCGSGGGGGNTTPTTTTQPAGSISGTLIIPGVSGMAKPSAAVLGISATTAETSSPPTQSSLVPGEVIVRFRGSIPDSESLSQILGKYQDVGLQNAGQVYPSGPYLLRTDAYKDGSISRSTALERTAAVIARLNTESSVEYAEPNYIAHSKMVPNDPAFSLSLQWDLRMMNLPTAWEFTTGSDTVIVAVIDTGIRFGHPDLDPNILTTGYDFVSDASLAGDGNGVDPDPTDTQSPISTFHGTHVAGTIAAVGNNGLGIAGVAWNVKVMPVRVLDLLGQGSVVDIINGLRYAAGLPNSSGKVPPQHAHVINMSLGSAGQCSQAYQEAITAVRNAGATIVVAAGNDGDSGNPVEQPASCQGVIAVGAVNSFAERAYYSGFQPYVFITAPGGDTSDVILGGILSTYSLSRTNDALYRFNQGTSMAAPHVAGTIALMLSAKSSLTPSEIENILASTPVDIGPPGRDPEYGFGLIDAGRAVAAAKGVPTPSVPAPYPLMPLLIIDQFQDYAFNVVLNAGGDILNLSSVSPFIATPSSGSWLSASLLDDPLCVDLMATNCFVLVAADRTGLASGLYAGGVQVASNGGDFSFPVLLQVGSLSLPDLGAITVHLFSIDPISQKMVVSRTTTTSASRNYTFSFPSVPPGDYLIDAGSDIDNSGFFGDSPGEANGVYPFPGGVEIVTVEPGSPTNGINFSITTEESILAF